MTPATAPGYLPDHPRIRGEHRILPPDQTLPGGSSPHTRGAPPGRPDIRPGLVDHPRIRGEHCCENPGTQTVSGSSPHPRGAPLSSRRISSAIRIIPAYAGSTRQILWTARRWPDHPRIRGEHVSHFVRALVASGSSPHTRGAPAPPTAPAARVADHPRIRGEHVVVGEYQARAARIIPAYAGSTTATCRGSPTWPDHPRIRGEH